MKQIGKDQQQTKELQEYALGKLAGLPTDQLVKGVLDEAMKRELSFTAWDITAFLRTVFPEDTRYVGHYEQQGTTGGVRKAVHSVMQQAVNAGTYNTGLMSTPNGDAILYSPAVQKPVVQKPLSAAARKAIAAPAGSWVIDMEGN